MSVTETAASETFQPASTAEVEDIVRQALENDIHLEVKGAGSKHGLGRPMNTSHALDTSALTKIIAYEPEELVLTAEAGVPLRDIAPLLADKMQTLAFEPPDFGTLLGTQAGSATLGGVIATNSSGPRRVKAGAARDHVLGVRAVSGRGEAFVAGGRVVKNVTGYDLPKLLAGSHGTLGILTEITVKLMPVPETEATLILHGLDDERAVRAMIDAFQSSCDISGAAHLQSGLHLGSGRIGASMTALRLEGFAPSVGDRRGALTARLAEFGRIDALDAQSSRALWIAIRDVQPFVENQDLILWRISSPPSEAAKLVARIKARLPAASALYDWGGALVWLAMLGPHPQERLVRDSAAAAGGHAMLFRAPRNVRIAIDVFPPLEPALQDLSLRVKDQFDPRRVLNPGRMYAWA